MRKTVWSDYSVLLVSIILIIIVARGLKLNYKTCVDDLMDYIKNHKKMINLQPLCLRQTPMLNTSTYICVKISSGISCLNQYHFSKKKFFQFFFKIT